MSGNLPPGVIPLNNNHHGNLFPHPPAGSAPFQMPRQNGEANMGHRIPMSQLPLHQPLPTSHRPGRQPRQKVEIFDIRGDHISEADARKKLSSYVVIRLEKAPSSNDVDEEGIPEQPTWEKVIHTEQTDISQQEATRKIRELERTTLPVTDKKSELPYHVQRQVEKAQNRLERDEEDPRYHYILAQLESHIRKVKDSDQPEVGEKKSKTEKKHKDGKKSKDDKKSKDSKKGKKDKKHSSEEVKSKHSQKRERAAVTVYFKRTPLSEENGLQMWEELEEERNRPNIPPQPRHYNVQMPHPLAPPILHQMPQQGPQHTQQQMPRQMPQQMPQQIPQHIAQQIPRQMPQQIPQHIPRPMPQQIPQQAPQQIPQQMPRPMPQHMPQQMPQQNPRPIPQNMPQQMPQQIPRQMDRPVNHAHPPVPPPPPPPPASRPSAFRPGVVTPDNPAVNSRAGTPGRQYRSNAKARAHRNGRNDGGNSRSSIESSTDSDDSWESDGSEILTPESSIGSSAQYSRRAKYKAHGRRQGRDRPENFGLEVPRRHSRSDGDIDRVGRVLATGSSPSRVLGHSMNDGRRREVVYIHGESVGSSWRPQEPNLSPRVMQQQPIIRQISGYDEPNRADDAELHRMKGRLEGLQIAAERQLERNLDREQEARSERFQSDLEPQYRIQSRFWHDRDRFDKDRLDLETDYRWSDRDAEEYRRVDDRPLRFERTNPFSPRGRQSAPYDSRVWRG